MFLRYQNVLLLYSPYPLLSHASNESLAHRPANDDRVISQPSLSDWATCCSVLPPFSRTIIPLPIPPLEWLRTTGFCCKLRTLRLLLKDLVLESTTSTSSTKQYRLVYQSSYIVIALT